MEYLNRHQIIILIIIIVKNGFSVIRLLQIDILKDKFDWIEELKSNISKINNEQKFKIYLFVKIMNMTIL